MVFCNKENKTPNNYKSQVTILILIDGFLQSIFSFSMYHKFKGHNPYFNRWFSAIKDINTYNLIRKESQSLF